MAFPKNAKCGGCSGKRPIVRAITMAPFDEAKKKWPEIESLAVRAPQLLMQRMVMIKENPYDKAGKPYVRIGLQYSCSGCAPAMERALAKLPSWVIVEINRGPGPDNPIIGVA